MHMHMHMYDKCVTLGAMYVAALSRCFYFCFLRDRLTVLHTLVRSFVSAISSLSEP